MHIVFNKISYKNFKSVGNSPIELDLTSDKITCIKGLNGAGKSLFISALCYALFGRGYGSINKPALINSINQKQLYVTLNFTIGKKEYIVNRGMKPNVFQIYEDGILINQDPNVKDYQKVLEQTILHFNYRAFTQVVVAGGSEYIPFMKLAVKDRRSFVEDILDINVFSTMNVLIKEKSKQTKSDLKDVEIELRHTKDKVDIQDSFIKKMKKEKSESLDKIADIISKATQDNLDITADIQLREIDLSVLKDDVSKHTALIRALSTIEKTIEQLKSNIVKIESKSKSYDGLITCPTCMQAVDSSHKHGIIHGYSIEISSIEAEILCLIESSVEITEKLSLLEKCNIEYSSIQKELSQLNMEKYSNDIIIKKSKQQLSDLKRNTCNIDEETDKLKILAREYLESSKSKKSLLNLQQYQEVISQILSDSGIKSKVISQFIPILNKLINDKLTDLDLYVLMELDSEFNESFKARYRDQSTYDVFSDGQKRRIDIAIMLAWLSVAKAKNSLSCNLLILDEVDAPLSSDGVLSLHATLKSLDTDNIFIITHKADVLDDIVDNTIEFELYNNFTRIKT